MNYEVPTSWQDCNEYQLKQISKVLFKDKVLADLQTTILLLQCIFTSKPSFCQRIKFRWLLMKVSVRELLPYLSFLNTMPKVYHFPKIKGLKAPAPYLASISIKQFSLVDKLFFEYQESKDELKLRQLVAALYCTDKFSEAALPKVAEITDQYPDLWHRILLSYISCRHYIIKKYPKIFPPPPEENPEIIKPEFRKNKKKYSSFNDVIITLAFEDPQPLGDYARAKETNVYEFLTVLTGSIIRQEKLEKEYAKRK